jgi:hypothetical protein
MKILLAVWQVVATLSGTAALICLVLHCVGEVFAIVEHRPNDVARMDDAGWAGLILLGLYMACQVGMIWLR